MSNTKFVSTMDKEQYADKGRNVKECEKNKNTSLIPDFKKGSFFDDLEDVGLFKWDCTVPGKTTHKNLVNEINT